MLNVLSPAKLPAAVKALYKRTYVDRLPIDKKEDFRPVLEQVLGPKLAAEVAKQAEVKGSDLLGTNTQKAVDEGAFGLPWIIGEQDRSSTKCNKAHPLQQRISKEEKKAIGEQIT